MDQAMDDSKIQPSAKVHLHEKLQFDDRFAISCGTITFDIKAKKVVLIYYRTRDTYVLPKGHKDIGETLEATSIRETFEESGVRAQLYPSENWTRATPAVGEDENTPRRHTEPFAVQQRVWEEKVLKIILWFLATADSTVEPKKPRELAHEPFDTVWAPVDEALGMLTREEDQRIVARAMAIVFGPAKNRAMGMPS